MPPHGDGVIQPLPGGLTARNSADHHNGLDSKRDALLLRLSQMICTVPISQGAYDFVNLRGHLSGRAEPRSSLRLCYWILVL
jgi:hypothetical protein